MTFKAGNEPAVPHQAYLYMKQTETGVETFFPFDIVASTAKAKLEIVPPLQCFCGKKNHS